MQGFGRFSTNQRSHVVCSSRCKGGKGHWKRSANNLGDEAICEQEGSIYFEEPESLD